MKEKQQPPSRIYHHFHNTQLSSSYSIEIYDKDDEKHVILHSKIHKNKEIKFSFCFSKDQFTDAQILVDRTLYTAIVNAVGHPFNTHT